MATTSIVCTACGTAVPYGRLSCPDCGELLASVGSARRSRATSNVARETAAPARAWESTDGHGEAVQPGEPVMTSDASTAPGAADGAMSSKAGVEPDKVAEFTGWLSVAGAALAAVGFILPWSSSVIGATGVGYFDR